MPYRLFPYERRLGLRELEQLGLAILEEDDGAVIVSGDVEVAGRRCTYFDHITADDSRTIVTQQRLVEAIHGDGRTRPAGRQSTRYGLHGIHEYKGKFNPQVVRALCNVVDPTAELLIDPFCGSGTGPLEGLRLGMDTLGIDRSPMAWYLATAKLEAAATEDKAGLAEDLLALSELVAAALERGQSSKDAADLAPVLGDDAASYLRDWLPAAGFAGISHGLALLHDEPESAAQRLALVALSSLLRSVSLQLPEDLRIRRRPEPFESPPLAPLFVEAVTVARTGLSEMNEWDEMPGSAALVCGSADDPSAFAAAAGHRRRLILTSPPYATALPYIDTDRLSLLALGLATSSELMPLERELLGSREWIRAEQMTWDERRRHNTDGMPRAVTDLLARIAQLNSEGTAGFRKQALPSLLYRYFAGMADAMSAWAEVLAQGERAVLIVGHNRTTANDERIDIPTPELLGEIATLRGFRMIELIRLETWPRYGLHAANGVPGEDALVIERAA